MDAAGFASGDGASADFDSAGGVGAAGAPPSAFCFFAAAMISAVVNFFFSSDMPLTLGDSRVDVHEGDL